MLVSHGDPLLCMDFGPRGKPPFDPAGGSAYLQDCDEFANNQSYQFMTNGASPGEGAAL